MYAFPLPGIVVVEKKLRFFREHRFPVRIEIGHGGPAA
jgi:hypothetical protein